MIHYISLYFIIFHYIALYFIIFHYISLYFMKFHYISLYFIIFNYISMYFHIYIYVLTCPSIFPYVVPPMALWFCVRANGAGAAVLSLPFTWQLLLTNLTPPKQPPALEEMDCRWPNQDVWWIVDRIITFLVSDVPFNGLSECIYHGICHLCGLNLAWSLHSPIQFGAPQ